MVRDSIKKIHGTRKLRKLLNEHYEGEVLDNLVADLYPLLDRVGYDSVEQIIRVCTQLARNSSRTAVTLLKESPALVDRLLRYGDKDLVMNVYGLSSQVSKYNEGTAVRLLAVSPELTDRVGYEGLEKIAGLCSQVATERRFIAALLEMTPGLIDKVGLDVLEKVAGLCGQVAGYSSRTAVRLLGQSSELIDKVGYDVLEEVVGLCSQVARRDSFVAARLLEMSPAHIDRVSYDCLGKMAELCCQVNKDDSFIAARVLDEGPELIARLYGYGDTELVTTVYGLCSQVAHDYNWRTAVRLLGKSPDLIERLLRYGDKELVMNVYGLSSAVGRYSWRTAVGLLEESPDLIGRAGYEGLEKVAYRASEIAKAEGEEKATSFVRGEASEYADFFEAITEGLELERVKPVLLHYLNALLGYRIEIVEARGAATTDGERIFLPGRVKEFEEEDKNFVLYKVMATHEEAHLEYGSFDFELVRVRDVVGRIKGKYVSAQ